MISRPPHETPLEAADVLGKSVVDVAGVPIRLGASDARRAEAVASLFRHASSSRSRPRCVLYFGDRDVGMPGSEATTTVAGTELWRSQPGQLSVRSFEGLTARSSSEEIVMGGDADSLARVFRHVCLISITHVLAQHGRHLMHAGAVVADGRVLLVLGGTGTGKSTLAFGAHRLGWPVLADDTVALHRRGGLVYAQGFPRPISVPKDVFVEAIPGGRPVLEDVRNRTELPCGTLAKSTHPVAGVVVTTRGDQRNSTIDSMSGYDSLRMALRASGSLGDHDLRSEVFAIAGALARLPAWSLCHGSDPASGLTDVTRQLTTIHRLLREPAGEPGMGPSPGQSRLDDRRVARARPGRPAR